MAIKISGTTVVDDSRQINNIGIITAIKIADGNGSVGSASSVLSSTGSGLSWVTQSGGASVANQADNRLISATGTTDALNGEANLTFDGTNLDVSGNVGINSSAPETRLDVIASYVDRTWSPSVATVMMVERSGNSKLGLVAGHTSYCQIDFGDKDDDNPGFIRYDNADNYMSFRTNGGEKLRIDTDGNVGIGTQVPTDAILVANTDVLAVGVVTTNSVYGKLNNLTYPTVDGTDGYVLTSDGSGVVQWEAAPGAGGGDANQDAFSNVAVAGQTTVAADSATDTLTLVAGTNVTITTDDSADSVTINASGGGGGGISMGKAIAAAMVFG